MTTAGPNSAGTGVNAPGGFGSGSWTGPTNITSLNGSAATIDGDDSRRLRASSFGFSVPATATLTEILFEFYRKADGYVSDEEIRVWKAGVVQAGNYSVGTVWGSSYAYFSVLVPVSGWVYTDVNNSGFGISLSVGAVSGTAYVDFVRCTITYTEPSSGVPAHAMYYTRSRN